jgi:hypothetical protein
MDPDTKTAETSVLNTIGDFIQDSIDTVQTTIVGEPEPESKTNDMPLIFDETQGEEIREAPVKPLPKERTRKPKEKTEQQTLEKPQYYPFILKQPTTIEEWVKAKRLFPSDFGYTENGDLEVPPIASSDIKKIIEIPRYVPGSIEYIQEYFKTRKDELKEPEEKYTIAKRQLHDKMMEYKNGDISVAEILAFNQNVREEEAKLNFIAKLPRKIRDLKSGLEIENPIENELNFDWYRRNPVAEPVLQTTYTRFPVRGFWMPSPEVKESDVFPAEVEEEVVEEVGQENMNKPKRVLTPQQIAIIRAKRGGFR